MNSLARVIRCSVVSSFSHRVPRASISQIGIQSLRSVAEDWPALPAEKPGDKERAKRLIDGINEYWRPAREAIEMSKRLDEAEKLFNCGDRGAALRLLTSTTVDAPDDIHPNVVKKLNRLFDRFRSATDNQYSFSWQSSSFTKNVLEAYPKWDTSA